MILECYQKTFKDACQFPLRIEKGTHAPTTSGVYLITEYLFNAEVIVYVGSSNTLRHRLHGHSLVFKLKKEKVFANIYVIPLRDSEYKDYEKDFIRAIKPKYNKRVYNLNKPLNIKI